MNIDEKIIWKKLDDETLNFFLLFAEVKGIKTPIIKNYNKDLANTISKKDALDNKGFWLSTGIVICVISFIAACSVSASDTDNKEGFLAFSYLGMFTGGLISLVQLTSPTLYDESKSAQIARKIKHENEQYLHNYHQECFEKSMIDYHRHSAFLDQKPSLEIINEYIKEQCPTDIEKYFFKQIISTRLRKIKEKKEAEESIRAIGTIIDIGLKVEEIHQLNQIENSLNNIENTLEDFA